jgi:hypothetical protein
VSRTALDPRLLSFVDCELLQLLLVGVAQAGDVDVGEAASETVHYCGCDVWARGVLVICGAKAIERRGLSVCGVRGSWRLW